MGTSTLEVLSAEECAARRDELLVELGMSAKEASERAADYSLSRQEMALWRAIEELTWLLDD